MPYQPTQNYYYSPNAQQTRQILGLKGRPVSSLEEVKAAAVDFDGSVSFFSDLANGKIYTKQCNIDGTASLNMYEIKEISVAPAANADYVTKEGKSGMRRMMYMESKETHQDTVKKVQDLENYMKELSSDIVEMLADASPEEKAIVQKKMNTLVSKIQNV